MKKWLLIILILVIAMACGITAFDLWGYIKQFIEVGVSYFFDLCQGIIDALAGKLQETAEGVTESTTTALAISNFLF